MAECKEISPVDHVSLAGVIFIATSIFIWIDIGQAQLHHFAIEAAGGGDIQSQTVGTLLFIDVLAKDSSNNTVITFNGTVSISSNGTLLSGGFFGMYAGDYSSDNFIDGSDFVGPDNERFLGGYRNSDTNMDGFVDGSDFLAPDNNKFKGTHVPN